MSSIPEIVVKGTTVAKCSIKFTEKMYLFNVTIFPRFLEGRRISLFSDGKDETTHLEKG